VAIADGHRVGFNQQPGHRAPDEQFTPEQAHSRRREELRRTRDGEGRHVHHALLLHVLHAHRARVLLLRWAVPTLGGYVIPDEEPAWQTQGDDTATRLECLKAEGLVMQTVGPDGPVWVVPFDRVIAHLRDKLGKTPMFWYETDFKEIQPGCVTFAWRNGLTAKALEAAERNNVKVMLCPGEHCYLDYPMAPGDLPEVNWGMPVTSLKQTYALDPACEVPDARLRRRDRRTENEGKGQRILRLYELPEVQFYFAFQTDRSVLSEVRMVPRRKIRQKERHV